MIRLFYPSISSGHYFSFMGSFLGSLGAVVNALGLHKEAFIIWMVSNPLLLIWAYGYYKQWWNGGLSAMSLMSMYIIFIVFNAYALWRFVL